MSVYQSIFSLVSHINKQHKCSSFILWVVWPHTSDRYLYTLTYLECPDAHYINEDNIGKIGKSKPKDLS